MIKKNILDDLDDNIESAEATTLFELGAQCFNKLNKNNADKIKAFKFFKLAADKGLAEARYNVGYCYQHGIGVALDKDEAVKYYALAATQGYPDAQFNLGICYLEGIGTAPNKTRAMQLFELAAAQGNSDIPEQLFKLSKDYMIVADGIDDTLKVFELFKIAADHGVVKAQYNMVYFYSNGIGVAPNMAKAIKYLTLAAENGDVDSQAELGGYYLGTDAVKAAKFLTLAADKGNVAAQTALAQLYQDGGVGVKKNEAAARLLTLAATNLSQSNITSKMVSYLTKSHRVALAKENFCPDWTQAKRNSTQESLWPQNRIDELKEGICNGLSILFLFCSYTQTQKKEYGINIPRGECNSVMVLSDSQKISSIEFKVNSTTLVITQEQDPLTKANKVYLVKNLSNKPASTRTGNDITMESFEIEITADIERLLQAGTTLTDSAALTAIIAKCTKPRDDYDWFKFTMKTIVNWDGKRKLTAAEEEIFEAVIAHVELFQNSIYHPELFDYRMVGPAELDKLVKSTKNTSPEKECIRRFTNIVSDNQLARILQTPNLIQAGKMVLIHIWRADGSMGHAIGLFKSGETFYYFDPERSTGELKSKSIDEIAAAIFHDNNSRFPASLEFSIFSMPENKHHARYPTDSEVADSVKESSDVTKFLRGPSMSLSPSAQPQYDNTIEALAALSMTI